MISPVCVPPVSKLHQQHELDEQEEEATGSSHIAPHCGREEKEQSHTTDGLSKSASVLGNSVLMR